MKRDILGQRFGRLFVDRFKGESGKDRTRVICLCDCGKTKDIYLYSLLSGDTQSCGCYNSESATKRFTTHGHAGWRKEKRAPEYNAWCLMLSRCKKPNNNAYKDYGARGISVDPAWEDFSKFLRDMGPRPKGTTLDRIDNNKGYGPSNCRWATKIEQARNKRNNVNLTFDGKTLCASAWAEITGLPHKQILRRVRYGWPVERILTAPLGG